MDTFIINTIEDIDTLPKTFNASYDEVNGFDITSDFFDTPAGDEATYLLSNIREALDVSLPALIRAIAEANPKLKIAEVDVTLFEVPEYYFILGESVSQEKFTAAVEAYLEKTLEMTKIDVFYSETETIYYSIRVFKHNDDLFALSYEHDFELLDDDNIEEWASENIEQKYAI